MTDPLAEARAAALRAVTDDDAPADIETLAREIQRQRWAALRNAQNRAIGGSWSMECGWIVDEIVWLARLVGPTSWEEISVYTLDEGLYDAVMEASGVDYERPDMENVAALKARIKDGVLSGRPRREPG